MWENHNNKSRCPSSSIPRHLFLQCCALSSTPLDFQGLVLMCVALLVCRVETIINLRLLRSCVSVSGQRPSSISASAMWRSSSNSSTRDDDDRIPYIILDIYLVQHPIRDYLSNFIYFFFLTFFFVNAASSAAAGCEVRQVASHYVGQRCAITKVFLSAISIGIHHFFFFFVKKICDFQAGFLSNTAHTDNSLVGWIIGNSR